MHRRLAAASRSAGTIDPDPQRRAAIQDRRARLDVGRDAGVELAHEPSWYIKNHFLFGMQDDLVAIRIRDEIGVKAMTWGTDFPHVASDWPHTGALLDKMFDGVPTEDARAILGGNLSKHLKLDRVPVAV